jgi:hypothetical protein
MPWGCKSFEKHDQVAIPQLDKHQRELRPATTTTARWSENRVFAKHQNSVGYQVLA